MGSSADDPAMGWFGDWAAGLPNASGVLGGCRIVSSIVTTTCAGDTATIDKPIIAHAAAIRPGGTTFEIRHLFNTAGGGLRRKYGSPTGYGRTIVVTAGMKANDQMIANAPPVSPFFRVRPGLTNRSPPNVPPAGRRSAPPCGCTTDRPPRSDWQKSTRRFDWSPPRRTGPASPESRRPCPVRPRR